jgi:hypothetical protein
MTFLKIFLVAVLTINVSVLPSACAIGAGAFPLFGSSTRKELVEEETKNHGISKTERIAKIKKRIKDEIKTARVAGASIESLKKSQDRGRGATRFNANNLQERKPKGLLKKKETTLVDVLFPGVSPEEFARRQAMPITVDTVTSHKTLIPFAYYELPVCGPDDIEQIRFKDRKRKNFGERLMGKSLESLSL